MYAVSYTSTGMGPCEARRPITKSWRHDQSVRILLNLENVIQIRDTLATIKEGVTNVKNRLQDAEEPNTRLWKQTIEIETRLTKLEQNFLGKSNRTKRGVAIAAVIGGLAGLRITSLGLYADLRNTVKTLQQSLPKLDALQANVNDIHETISEITDKIEYLNTNMAI
ncbi:hypothetical protein E2C01_070578 [Portunus trituberculatus]|uniref:Uncharacterized protein n=1 Tax=Portunus trituberculatus TaxID=210409 RepID=A0A5B7HXN9_PORTR|nr:hypothetical protein [Portunus trituberculatus]